MKADQLIWTLLPLPVVCSGVNTRQEVEADINNSSGNSLKVKAAVRGLWEQLLLWEQRRS